MFLLKSGSASITVKDGGQSRVAGHITPGQCFGEISLWIESKRSSTVTSTSYSHLYVLTRVDLDEVLQRFPEMQVCLATNAISSCLRVPSITPALAGISVKTSERLGRRMAFSKCNFENGEIIVQAGQQATTAFVIRCALNCFVNCAQGNKTKIPWTETPIRACRSGKVLTELERLEILSDPRTVGMTELFAQQNYQETVRAKGRVSAYALTVNDVLDLLAFNSDCNLESMREHARAHFKVVHRCHLGMFWWVSYFSLFNDRGVHKRSDPMFAFRSLFMYDLLALEESRRTDEADVGLLSRIGSALARTGSGSEEASVADMNTPISGKGQRLPKLGAHRTSSDGSTRSLV